MLSNNTVCYRELFVKERVNQKKKKKSELINVTIFTVVLFQEIATATPNIQQPPRKRQDPSAEKRLWLAEGSGNS